MGTTAIQDLTAHIGQHATLNSGGPRMLIEGVTPDQEYVCSWTDAAGERQVAAFLPATVQVEPAPSSGADDTRTTAVPTRPRGSAMITEDNPTVRDPADSTLIYYGPHECGRCGKLIVKAAREQGGAEFDYPRGPEPIYPNSRWRPHDCDPADVAAQPRVIRISDADALQTYTLSGVDLDDLAAVRDAVSIAKTLGHWRRILAIYGNHLPRCARHLKGGFCDCGWVSAFESS